MQNMTGATPRARAIVLAGLILAVASGCAALFSGFGYQLGWWHFRTGFGIIKWSFVAAIVSLLLLLVGLALSRRTRAIVAAAVFGIVIAVITVAVPLGWKRALDAHPYLHDITTDVNDPPQFVAVAALRGRGDHPVSYDGEQVAAAQREAYPDLQPLRVPVPPVRVFEAAKRVVDVMGMELVAANDGDLHLEATDTTLLYGFKDDMVIRIVETDSGSRVDVRSKSRVGRSDLGQNARRIRAFIDALRSELGE